MNKILVKFILTLFLQIFLINLIFAQGPKEKKGKKKSKEVIEEITLDTIEVEPFNPILRYQAVPTRYFNLIHTKLDLRPSFEEKKLYGTATISMVPHFHSQQSVELDAKGMDITFVRYQEADLSFQYDGKKLNVILPKLFTRKDTLTLEIKYVAKPYELDSATIKMGRGMYFINSKGTNPYKPTHLWTQGETVAASCWFPTFDVTYQKTTQEVKVTMDNRYTSFSNGLLLEQKLNGDGTRTDYWKQSLPHAPYLFVLVVGEYQKYQDKWRNTKVNYYTYPKYFNDIKEVFGRTPDMMEHFSQLLGVDYPWEKYDQIMTYDYTAGAMENTGASVFYEFMLCNHQDMIDREYGHDMIIAHELFHQWFGDLITCENWSQLTLNESFANYGEMLWMEKWRGIDDAELHWYNDKNDYLNEFRNGKAEPIVYHFFKRPDEVFDRHRYDKGGRVLHMLRNYLGDEAFFASIQHFLTTKSFKSAEIHDLRLSFEEVTGEDMNWFFNQWWLSPGHPMVTIKNGYDITDKMASVNITQTQKSFTGADIPLHKIPLDISLIFEDSMQYHRVWVTKEQETFQFPCPAAPLAINVDPGKLQLWERKDNLSTNELLVIFERSPKILDKVFVFEQLKSRQSEPEVKTFLLQTLQHKHSYIRRLAVNALTKSEFKELPIATSQIISMAIEDPSPAIRRDALAKLSYEFITDARQAAIQILDKDSSFAVLAKALDIIKDSSLALAYSYAVKLDTHENQQLTVAVAKVYADTALSIHYPFFERALYLQWANSYYALNEAFYLYLLKVDTVVFEKGLALLKNIIQNEETQRHIKAAKKTLQKLNDLKVSESVSGNETLSQDKKAILSNYISLLN